MLGRETESTGEGRVLPQPADVAHLLRRAGFGGTAAQIATLAAEDWATTVDQLLDFSTAPADVEPAYLTDDTVGDWQKEFNLKAWWLDRMATTTTPLQEKLTLFWHWALRDRELQGRRHVADVPAELAVPLDGDRASFLDLVQTMALQPAMLLWLDNGGNTKGNPNENFALELMELFTLGVDEYTQDDIVASACAWTGHNTLDSDRTQYYFYAKPPRHLPEDVHGRDPELGRPRHHQLLPAGRS